MQNKMKEKKKKSPNNKNNLNYLTMNLRNVQAYMEKTWK